MEKKGDETDYIIQWLHDHPKPKLTEEEKTMKRKLYAPLPFLLGIYCYFLIFAHELLSVHGNFVFVFLFMFTALLISFLYFHLKIINEKIEEEKPESITLEMKIRLRCIQVTAVILYLESLLIMVFWSYYLDVRDYDMIGMTDTVYFIHLIIAIMVTFYAQVKYLQFKKTILFGTAARKLELNFSMHDPYNTIERYGFIDTIRNVVSGMTIACVISGTYRKKKIRVFIIHPKGHPAIIFCIYMTFLKLSTEFPELKAWPAGSFRVGMKSDLPEVDFDNLEFSRKYNVKCGSRQFANDVFHPRMMELFLQQKAVYFEIEKDIMFTFFRDLADPSLLKEQLDKVISFREMLPSYLFPADEDSILGDV